MTRNFLAMIAGPMGIATLVTPAAAQPTRPDQQAFLDIYRDLVETDTSIPSGDCTLAARKMLDHLRKAGFDKEQAEIFVPDGHPKEGGLIARIEGSDPDAGAMLLVDHIDVVAARREDWPRDPFKMVEENGYFIARGVIDDKALSAIWVDSLIRMKAEDFRPRRTIKIALTCGEESGNGVNGVTWLLDHRRDAVEAAMAFNEGGHGITDQDGKPVALYLAVGEKSSANFIVETRDAGGHSSRPRADNAIYDLAAALLRIRALRFPLHLSDTTRSYLERMAPLVGGTKGRAMRALAANPTDRTAEAIVTSDPTYNGMLRTTCVATMLEGGHAVNALPQRARATIQCRLLPGDTSDAVHRALTEAVDDAAISITPATPAEGLSPVAVAPPLTEAILHPAEEVAHIIFPGVPVVPTLLTAGTDGRYLNAAGIPTYGIPGILLDPDSNGAHGVNERIRTESMYRGRDYLYMLIRRYAMEP